MLTMHPGNACEAARIGERPCTSTSCARSSSSRGTRESRGRSPSWRSRNRRQDRKSTRLNSSHLVISYAVFCLKKKTRNILHSTAKSDRARVPLVQLALVHSSHYPLILP